MKKIILGVLMLMIVSLFTLTVTAAPAENADILVNEEYIFDAYEEETLAEIEGVSYDKTTNTLTLKNANVKVIDTYTMGEDFKINVVGENTVEAFKIYESSVEFTGTGILNLKATEEIIEDFIMVDGATTKVGALTINMVNNPPYEYKYGIFGGDSDVELNGTKISFDEMDCVIQGKEVVLNNAIIKGKIAYAIIDGQNIYIKNSEIYAEDVEEAIYTYAEEDKKGNIVIDNSKIEITKEIGDNAIFSEGKISINNSTLKLITTDRGTASGISSIGDMVIKGSEIAFVSGDAAIYSDSKVTLENTKLTAKDVIFGIYSFDTIDIKGGTIDIKSDLLAVVALSMDLNNKKPVINLSEGMIVEPNASIKEYTEDSNYLQTFATGDLKLEENGSSVSVTNAVKEIKIYEPIKYTDIKVSDTKYTIGKDDTVTIKINAEFSTFKTVYVNGKELAKDQYTAKEGSTIITISKAYLSKLAKGEYKVTVEFTNGTAETSFKVEQPVKDKTPATGSVNYIPYVTIVAVVSLAGVIVCKKAEQN